MTARRARAEREILDASWALMASEGVAALNVREVARSVGLRQQSLTYYFPTKQDLLDALFADGFADLKRVFDELPAATDPSEGVVDVAVAFVDYCVANPPRYHLMFQGTIPGFQPSDHNHRGALKVLAVLIQRLTAADIDNAADIAIIRSVMSGLAAEQIANDPQGRAFADQTARAVRYILTSATGRRPRRQAGNGQSTIG
jgi:AcrR family transcriptional regulator